LAPSVPGTFPNGPQSKGGHRPPLLSPLKLGFGETHLGETIWGQPKATLWGIVANRFSQRFVPFVDTRKTPDHFISQRGTRKRPAFDSPKKAYSREERTSRAFKLIGAEPH